MGCLGFKTSSKQANVQQIPLKGESLDIHISNTPLKYNIKNLAKNTEKQ